MSKKHIAVFGIYRDRSAVEHAANILKHEGFGAGDVSVLFSDHSGNHTMAHHKDTKAPEGASVGAGTGALLGGALGWLIGVGSLAIPGVGPFIAAGPIMAALAGVGVGSVVGGISGALVGMGVPEYEAKRYEGILKEGGILLSVHCIDAADVTKAKDVLCLTGAHDIGSETEVAPVKWKKDLRSEPRIARI